MQTIRVGNRIIGEGQPVFFIAEIGINHNGSVDLAQRLISASCHAGVDAVKFQKRTVDVVYTSEELARPRENPFGQTNGDLKRGLEFDEQSYEIIAGRAREHGLLWSTSCWDEASLEFIERFDPPFYKIASACLTDSNLLREHRALGKPVFLSTGMSTVEEIDQAVQVLGTDNLVLLHTTSTYPSKTEELNLRVIGWLRDRYQVPVGYSGHEQGLATSSAAVALGACVIERHITLDRTMWGSDQAASIEPAEFQQLVEDCRNVSAALGNGRKVVYDSELPVREKLRRGVSGLTKASMHLASR